jgi:chromosomal replication initiator protein
VEEKYLQYIANNITANVRQLEGTVKKLAATSSLMGKEITQSSVSAAVKDVLRETPGLKPTANLIIEEVASFYDIEPDALRSNSRRKDTLTPRQVAMYVMREMTGMSLPEIGREFGKDHATVLHAVKKIEQNIRAGKEPKNEVRDIIHNITNR